MDVEASLGAIAGKREREDIIQAVRARLYRFEPRLQRLQLWAERDGSAFTCCLQAWSERGQTLAVERKGPQLLDSIFAAVDALARALERGRTSETITRPYASRVLLALLELDAAAPSLLWARRLAQALAGGLDACRVLKGAPGHATLGSGREWLATTRQLLAAQRDTRSWCSAALPEAVLAERVFAGAGDWVRELASLGRRKGSDWLVVPASDITGDAAVTLARAAGCPVLVARAPTTRSTLLLSASPGGDDAATLASAAELSEALNAPVLAFENLFGHPADGRAAPRSATEVERLAESWDRLQRERHPLEAGRRLPPLDVLLGFGADRPQALLSQALREDAEMIVLGVGPAAAELSPSDRAFAARVVERAVRSVLLVPAQGSSMDERAARRAPPRSGVVPAAGASSERAPSRSARSGSGA